VLWVKRRRMRKRRNKEEEDNGVFVGPTFSLGVIAVGAQ